jgi:hypothetical protein
MKTAHSRFWLSDQAAWAIFATGLVAMLGVFYVVVEFGDYGDLPMMMARRRVLGRIFFAVAGFAISGPLAASVATVLAGRAARSLRKKQSAIGFEDL